MCEVALSSRRAGSLSLSLSLSRMQSPMLGAHTHAHPYPWVLGGHGCDVIFHRWAWVGISFVHPCIQIQIGVKLLGCREYANQEALWAEANDSERPFICLIQPRLGVGG
jgi:hypothetical protein